MAKLDKLNGQAEEMSLVLIYRDQMKSLQVMEDFNSATDDEAEA